MQTFYIFIQRYTYDEKLTYTYKTSTKATECARQWYTYPIPTRPIFINYLDVDNIVLKWTVLYLNYVWISSFYWDAGGMAKIVQTFLIVLALIVFEIKIIDSPVDADLEFIICGLFCLLHTYNVHFQLAQSYNTLLHYG